MLHVLQICNLVKELQLVLEFVHFAFEHIFLFGPHLVDVIVHQLLVCVLLVVCYLFTKL